MKKLVKALMMPSRVAGLKQIAGTRSGCVEARQPPRW